MNDQPRPKLQETRAAVLCTGDRLWVGDQTWQVVRTDDRRDVRFRRVIDGELQAQVETRSFAPDDLLWREIP